MILPSDEWQSAEVHWHAYSERRTPGNAGLRPTRLAREPEATLHSPWQVTRCTDQHTREHVLRREVFALRDGVWVEIGDEEDLAHLRHENFLIASRGGSIYTDIYTGDRHHDLYVEAVTDVQCQHDCADSEADSEPE